MHLQKAQLPQGSDCITYRGKAQVICDVISLTRLRIGTRTLEEKWLIKQSNVYHLYERKVELTRVPVTEILA